MGLRYRKSIKLFDGFRINISGSGIGYSWGTKGYRITNTATGSVRQTISLPGTGLSYVNTYTPKKTHNEVIQSKQGSHSQEEVVTKADMSNVQECDSSSISASIQKRYNLYRYLNIVSIVLLILGLQLLLECLPVIRIILLVLSLLSMVINRVFLKIKLDYNLSSDANEKYNSFIEFYKKVCLCQKVQAVNSSFNLQEKYSSGVGSGFTFSSVGKMSKLPVYLHTETPFIGLKICGFLIYFMPDGALLFKDKKVSMVPYSDIEAGCGITVHVATREEVPSESKVIKTSYLYTNKDGSPDLRFSNNPVTYFYEIGTIGLESNCFRILITISQTDLIDCFEIISQGVFKDFVRKHYDQSDPHLM